MNIIIFGASGRTGQHLVRQALSQGNHVTAFVRNASKLTMAHENLVIIEGDITDASKVREVLMRQDAVLCTLGASSPFKYDQAVVDGAGNIIHAMTGAGVNRFIYMSFIGVPESRQKGGFVIKNIAPLLLSTEIAGHEARENMIKKSGLQWTIIRAATLTNGIHTGKYRFGEYVKSNGFIATISRADVADVMLTQLHDDSYLHKAPAIMY